MASKTSDLVFNLIGHDKTGPATKSAASNLDHVSKSATNMGKVFAGVAAGAGLAVLGKQAMDFAKDSVAAFTTVGKEAGSLQRVMGGTIEEASSMRGMFKLAGVDAEQAGKSMGLFSKSIVNNGDAFAAMGVAVRDAGGQLRPTNDILKDTAEQFKSMPNGAEKTALAMELFGKSGAAMLPFLNRGAEGLTELEKKTAEYGLTLTKVDQEAIGGAIKAQRELDMAMEGAKVTLGSGLAPLFTEAKTAMAEMAVPLTQALLPGFEAIGDVAMLALTQIRDNMPAVQSGVAQFASGIRGVSESIQNNWPQIVETVEALGGTLKRVGEFTAGVWAAFQSLPDGVKQTLMLAAVAQKTGALAITFKAVDIVKSLFASAVPVMNVGVLNSGTGAASAASGLTSAGGTMGKGFLATAATAVAWTAAAGAFAVVATQVLVDNADKWAPRAQAAYEQNPTINSYTGIATPDNFTRGMYEFTEAEKSAIKAAFELRAGLTASQEAQQMHNRSAAIGAAVSRDNALAMTSLGLQAGISGAELAAVNQVVASMPAGTEATVLAAAIQSVGVAAGMTQPEIDAMTAAATGIPPGENVAALGLRISEAGSAAGLSEDQMLTLNSAVAAMPPGTTAEQLRAVIQSVGEQSGLTQGQIDALTGSINVVPAAANLPALQMAIAVAGQAAGLSQEQVDDMSAAVTMIPPGATAEQMGEAIRIAGVKAGMTDQQIQGVTAAANSVPANTPANVSTNAPEETGKINALQSAINGLQGKNISVGVSISGSTGGGGTSTFSGSASGVGGWMDDQVTALAKKLAPTLLGVSGGAYAGPGGGVLGRPLNGYVVSSEFGPRGGAMHYGIDLAAPMGTGVFASAPGLIMQSGWNGGYGNFIAMDHGLGIVTRYGHMSNLIGRAGQVVGQGALIGQVGSTGDSTGPHLHFEAQVGGNFVNPRTLVALRHGGLVPTALSRGEYYVPREKAKGNYALLSAANAGVLSGPGTSTSDSIRALTRGGDFIVNAAATRRHRALLDSVVKGPRRMATGGVVGGTVTGGSISERVVVQVLLDGRQMHEAQVRYLRDAGVSA